MQIIRLNATDHQLIGKMFGNETDFRVVCDTQLEGFTIQLPDLLVAENKEFTFYNIPLAGSGGNITILPVTSQSIGVNVYTYTLAASSVISFIGDKRSMWLVV